MASEVDGFAGHVGLPGSRHVSDADLFRDFNGVVDFDAEKSSD